MPNAPITVGELVDVPAPGSSVASAFHVEVANRINQRFATKAALDGWAAQNGAVAFTADQSRLWLRMAGVWRVVAGSMPRVLLKRSAPVSVANTTNFPVPWDVETYDTDALHAAGATAIVVPTVFAGRWRFEYAVGWDVNSGGSRAAWIDTGGIRYVSQELAPVPGSGVPLCGSVEILCAAGQTVNLYVYQTSGVALNVATNAQTHYFSAQYIGPA